MRLIDVDKIVFYTPRWCDDEGLFVKWLKEIFKNVPTVEAVPVIRCKDCIQWDKYDLMPRDADGKERHHCPHIGTDTDKYFFCRDGEMEEE